MHTTDPSDRESAATPPWATGRHRRRSVDVPEQRDGSASRATFPDPAVNAPTGGDPGSTARGSAAPGSTDPGSAAPGSASPGSTARGSTDPAARGWTEIADRVVQKIAAAALAEIAEIGGPAGRIRGIGSDGPDHRPRVSVTVHGTAVDLEVRASVRRPAPVAEVVERARARVTARIAETTDLQVRRLDVTVTALPAAPSPAGRAVR